MGLPDLIQACGTLVGRGLDVRLIVCGDGDERAAQAAADAVGLHDRLDWLGPSPRAEVLRQLEEAAVAVAPTWPSYPEGLPLTLMEPLGMGLPVVASDHRAWSRLVDREEIAVHGGADTHSLADSLHGALCDKDLYVRLSRNGPNAFRRLRAAEIITDAQHRWAAAVLESPAR